MQAAVVPALHGSGSSRQLSQTLSTSCGVFHSMPLSSTAITVSGRPVVTSQARLTPAPFTPKSSCGFEATAGS